MKSKRQKKGYRTIFLDSPQSYAWTQGYLAIALYITNLSVSDYSMIKVTLPDPTLYVCLHFMISDQCIAV